MVALTTLFSLGHGGRDVVRATKENIKNNKHEKISNQCDWNDSSSTCISISSFSSRGSSICEHEYEPVQRLLIGTDKVKRKKRVTFDLKRNVQYPNPYETKRKDLWYAGTDYKTFQSHAKAMVSHVVNQSHTWTHRKGGSEQCFSYQQIKDLVVDVQCCRCIPMIRRGSCTSNHQNDRSIVVDAVSCSEFGHLVRWLDIGSFSYGLEKQILVQIARDKNERRRLLFSTMKQIQVECKKQQKQRSNQKRNKNGHANANDGATSNKLQMEESIRTSCEEITRPCRLFARIMGLAVSVSEEEEDETNVHYHHHEDDYRELSSSTNQFTFSW